MDTRSKQSPCGASTADTDTTSTPRRRFLGAIATGLTGGLMPFVLPRPARAHRPVRLHLQDCRIAGSHYYACAMALPLLRVNDALQLHHQPDNPHDSRAIEVFWHHHKLGYLPRLDNAAAASLADRGHTLRAEIIGIGDPNEVWEPVRLRVWASIS